MTLSVVAVVRSLIIPRQTGDQRLLTSSPTVFGLMNWRCALLGAASSSLPGQGGRLREPRRVIGPSWESHRACMGESPGITLRLLEAPQVVVTMLAGELDH